MIATLELSLPLQEQLRNEALRAYPRESCGLVEGFAEGELVHAVALHSIRNVAQCDDRFEIDPAAHIALLRMLRGTGREIIGCFHSHPNGRAEPSEHDRESAIEPGFLWLICAVNPDTQESSIAALESVGQGFSPVRIVRA